MLMMKRKFFDDFRMFSIFAFTGQNTQQAEQNVLGHFVVTLGDYIGPKKSSLSDK